jgi:hypothetical protein
MVNGLLREGETVVLEPVEGGLGLGYATNSAGCTASNSWT